MKFYNLLNFSLIAICITYSQGAPLEPRVNPPFFVLNNNPKNTFSCNAAQIAYIRTAVTKAADIASSAANVYSAAGMSQNPIVKSFLGEISEAAFRAEVTKRFKNVAAGLERTLSEVSENDIDKIQEDDALSFFCQNSRTLLAATSNIKDPVPAGTDPASENRITLGKKFFQTESAEALFNKDQGIFEAADGDLTKWATALDNPGHTLVHEAQHSLILLGSTNPNDNLKDLTNSAGKNNRPNACIALKTAAEKQSNAENWALLAFVAAVDPDGVRGCTPGTPPVSKRAVAKTKGTTGTKSPLSCPFVPKGKTAVTTGKTATPATAKTATAGTAKKTTAGTTAKTKATTAKKGTVAKSKATVPKKTTTAKTVTPVKTASKKITTAKKVTPVKKTAPVKKATAPKKVAVKKTTKRV